MTAGTMTDGRRQQSSTVPASREALINRHPATTPRWWRDVAGILAWVSMLVVVALWVSNRGLQSLTTLGGGITSLGRLVGLISADLLLIQVLLMARIPLIEKVYGQDELAVRHRTVGFCVVQPHAGTHRADDPGLRTTEHVNVITQTWRFVVDYPGMLLAVGATLMLSLVVVTSIKKARATLRYESWHLIHLYAYLGVGLSIPHEVWTGADFTLLARSPSCTGGRLYLAAAGAVLYWRVALPLWRARGHRPERVRGGARRPRRGVRRPAWPRLSGAGRPRRAVLHLAVPRRPGLDPRRTPTRCPPSRATTSCGSPSRTWATTAPA